MASNRRNDFENAPKDGSVLLTYCELSGYQLVHWGEYPDYLSDDFGAKLTGWTDGDMPIVWDGKAPDWWYLLEKYGAPPQHDTVEPVAWIVAGMRHAPEHVITSQQEYRVASRLGGNLTPLYTRPPAQPDTVAEVTMADAIAAGDGTLHGAIDYWQKRAMDAEATLDAFQDADETTQQLASNYIALTCGKPDTVEVERDEFEKWAADEGYSLECFVEAGEIEYIDHDTESEWRVWQERALLEQEK